MSLVNRKAVFDLARIFANPAIDHDHQIERIDFMEENVFLPVKVFVILLLFNFIYYSGAFTRPDLQETPPPPAAAHTAGNLPSPVELSGDVDPGVSVGIVKKVFWAYVFLNIVSAAFLLYMHRFSIGLIQWVVFLNNLADAAFLTAWTVETGALKDSLYWIFLGLIIRNAVSIPVPTMQIGSNLIVIGCFTFAGMVDKAIVSLDLQRLDADDVPLEAFSIRIFLMIMLTVCCYGVQVLFDARRRAREDFEEFSARQKQLETAGRLAAEIAHRIKNPLAIMTNAVYTLERQASSNEDPKRRDRAVGQLGIIKEELERSDRIITELMGYAQLAEGKVENLDPVEELEAALSQILPPGSAYEINVTRDYKRDYLPMLKMQRGHLREILLNVLKNSRDILEGKGEIKLSVEPAPDFHVKYMIEDNGPGVPPDKVEQIFEPYFTTNTKGSGLGLAIVKHNTEIYGGHVRVESELGRGARFVITLPTKTLMRMNK